MTTFVHQGITSTEACEYPGQRWVVSDLELLVILEAHGAMALPPEFVVTWPDELADAERRDIRAAVWRHLVSVGIASGMPKALERNVIGGAATYLVPGIVAALTALLDVEVTVRTLGRRGARRLVGYHLKQADICVGLVRSWCDEPDDTGVAKAENGCEITIMTPAGFIPEISRLIPCVTAEDGEAGLGEIQMSLVDSLLIAAAWHQGLPEVLRDCGLGMNDTSNPFEAVVQQRNSELSVSIMRPVDGARQYGDWWLAGKQWYAVQVTGGNTSGDIVDAKITFSPVLRADIVDEIAYATT